MTFICELNSSVNSKCKKERKKEMEAEVTKMKLKGKKILNKTVENSPDKIHYKRITVINLHEDKI